MLTRKFAAWAVLVGAVVIGLLYLNSAAYSAWAGGGPPTAFREAWMQRAFAHLSYAAGAIFLGVAAFRAIRRLPRLETVGLLLAVLALLAVGAPTFRRFVLASRCTDGGGRWDEPAFKCER
jgi:hypothetical protein